MSDDFEDHCWKDIVTPDVLEVYSCYRRKVFIGASPALLAIDLYDVVYRGGARPPAELAKTHPNSCGEYAFAAVAGIDLQHVRRDDVLPAMVFEIIAHGVLLPSRKRRGRGPPSTRIEPSGTRRRCTF